MGHGGPPVTSSRDLHRLALGAVLSMLVGCAAKGPGPLYLWEAFPRQQYDALLRGGFSPEEQIRQLESHAEKARAGNAALPPGLRAHLGMLHLGAGNAERARELWKAEMLAFPESSAYMDQLIRKLDAQVPSKKENPA